MQLFHQNIDVDARVAGPVLIKNKSAKIELENGSPGLYYIYIYSNSGHNQEHEYTLLWISPKKPTVYASEFPSSE